MRPFPIVMAGAVGALVAVVGLHSRTPAGPTLSAAPTTTAPSTSTTAPSTSTTAPSPTPTTAAPAAVTVSATGPIEQYGYGELSVRVTVSGNTITHLSVPTLQTAEQYSQQLAAQVIPMLTSEVLKAQSVNINGISGATYTAEAYVTSLQAALKKAHFT